ncbi:MAG: CoA transferase [Candidatus Nanopelagicales bacterium]
MPGALDGVVVADFTRILAGPYCTMLLADLGAEVIKIERPEVGDDTRTWGPPFDPDGRATYFESVNRNKTSRVLDLGSPAGREAAGDLARSADVLIENFTPGTMARFGLGFTQIQPVNPGLVYCSITGFGSGAGAALPGYDPVVQAVGGLMSVTGPDSDHPSKAGVAVVDVIAGLHAAMGILAALRHRDRTGEGQLLEVNLLQSLLSGLVNQTTGYVAAGVVPTMRGNEHPSIAPFETFPTADRPIMICAGNDRQFAALCRVLGLDELPDDDRFRRNKARVAHRLELVAVLADTLATRPAADWLARLAEVGVPAGPVNSIAEAVALAEDLGLDPVVEIAGPDRTTPSRTIAHPVHYSATPPRYELPPPSLPASS